MRGISLLIVLISLNVPTGLAQNEKTFPTDDEIKLLLTQTERAMQQYEPLINQEETLMSKNGVEAAAKDREALDGLRMALKTFKGKPQAFNGPLGFFFFESLDDVDRNLALCGSGALSQATLQMMAGNTARANSLVHLAQSCSDADALMYTVSENAGSLYQRYVEAEAQLAAQGFETAQKCAQALKNSVPPKK